MGLTIKSRNKWANSQAKYYWYDSIRVLLGIFLIFKGNSFISNPSEFEKILETTQFASYTDVAIQIVASVHIVGGILITFGLLTRWALLLQLPLLFGAIAVNFMGEMNSNNLMISAAAFLISLFYFWFGSGKHSADCFFKLGK